MEYLQQTLAVLAVFGILGASLWWLRRRGIANIAAISMPASKKSSRVLSQIERLPISPTHSLHLVRMADRAILVASWPGGCQAIESSSWNDVARHEKDKLQAGDTR
jgi:flagellar biogenesis protein FliO